MVKRTMIFIIALLLLSLPSWAAEPLIVDEAEFLSEEETEAIGDFIDAMEQIFSMEIGTFLLVPDYQMQEGEFEDFLEENFPFSNERNLYFAYDHVAGFFYAASNGIEELDSQKIQDALDKALATDSQDNAFVTLMGFYRGIYDILQPTLGTPASSSSGGAVVIGGGDEPTDIIIQSGEETLIEAKVYLEDGANLWTEDQRENLRKAAEKLSSREDIAIVLVTTDNNPDKTSEEFIEDLAEEKFGIDTDQVAFLIDMDNRNFEVNTSGRAIDVFHDQRIESILDELSLAMAEAEYYLAATTFLQEADKYLSLGIDPAYKGRKERRENNLSALDGVIGLGAGGLAGLLNFARVKKSYAKKTSPLGFQYQNNLIGGIPLQAGSLLNKRVTQRKIPKSTGSGSDKSSSTHTSSSGGTRGGGGRSF